MNGNRPIPDTDQRKPLWHILVVDDEISIIYFVEWVLEDISCTVSSAMNAEDAINRAIEKRPDLIILDLRMPINAAAAGLIDPFAGISVCDSLRSHPDTEDIPIIMLTVMSESEGIDKSVKAGANEYLTKPFHSDALLQVVNKYLK